MRDKIGNEARLLHILDSIVEIEQYTNNISLDDFLKNKMMQNACIRLLEVIGEATNHISDDIKLEFPEIAWREIVGLRNLLLHEYFGVDLHVVLAIIQSDLPSFKSEINKIYIKIKRDS